MNNVSDAINALLKGDLERAIELNSKLIKENPKDLEALNRLAFAYNATGNGKKARELYKKVLKFDSTNQIALKNIKKIPSDAPSSTRKKRPVVAISNDLFIEEVGKTKIISLVNTAQPKKLKELQVGQTVDLVIKRSKIFALVNEDFIGKLPDNLSIRLLKFFKGGNKYETYIKSVEGSDVKVFIKEVKRSIRFKNQPSFLSIEPKKTKLNFSSDSKNYLED